MKKITIFRFLIFSIFFFGYVTGCSKSIKNIEDASKRLGKNPYFEVDNQPVQRNEFIEYNPEDIASLTIYGKKSAVKLFGNKAKDGAVTVETIKYATDKYETFFKSVSSEYKEMLTETKPEDIQYILNDSVLTKHFAASLSSLDLKTLKDIKIIERTELVNKYQVNDKLKGVVIRANLPENKNK